MDSRKFDISGYEWGDTLGGGTFAVVNEYNLVDKSEATAHPNQPECIAVKMFMPRMVEAFKEEAKNLTLFFEQGINLSS